MTKCFFNLHRLVVDLGGPTAISKSIGCCRTAVYGWIARGNISSAYLEKLKDVHPNLNINDYFERSEDAGKSGGGSQVS